MVLLLPSVVFWVLIVLGRSEIGFKGVTLCVLLWLGFLLGFRSLAVPIYWFTAVQSVIDAVLILVIFGGDLRIR